MGVPARSPRRGAETYEHRTEKPRSSSDDPRVRALPVARQPEERTRPPTDLIDRLHKRSQGWMWDSETESLCGWAAWEITRLRQARDAALAVMDQVEVGEDGKVHADDLAPILAALDTA